jgi:hypothetical protein
MGRAYGMYGGEAKCTQGFVGKSVGKRQFEDLSLDGRIILKMDLQEVG